MAEIVQIPDLRTFVEATSGPGSVNDISEMSDFCDGGECSQLREYLKRFANIDVPDPCHWKMCVLYIDDLEWDTVFETPDQFIRYHWESTA